MLKWIKVLGVLIASLVVMKYVILYVVPDIGSPESKLQELMTWSEEHHPPFKDGEQVELIKFKACIAEAALQVERSYLESSAPTFDAFEGRIKHYISNDGDEDDFIDWMNGWANGYRLALNKGLDILGYVVGRQDNLERLIQDKYDEMVIKPAISEYHDSLIKLQNQLRQEYIVNCATVALTEQYEHAERRNSLDGYVFNWRDDGVVFQVLSTAYEQAQDQRDEARGMLGQVLGEPDELKTRVKQAKIAHGAFKALKSGRSLKHVISTARQQVASKANVSIVDKLGAGAGGAIGGLGVNLALKGLASKGLMGKTSVFLFKASGSKVISSLGLSSITKMVSAKAASAAGGKILFLVAEKSVVAATSAATFGISAAIDYLFSKGMGAAQRSSMEEAFFKSAPYIRKTLEKEYHTSMRQSLTQAQAQLMRDVELSVSKTD